MQVLHILKSFTFICLKITDYRGIKHSLFCLDKQVCASNITDNSRLRVELCFEHRLPKAIHSNLWETLLCWRGFKKWWRLSVFAFDICPLGRLASLLHGCWQPWWVKCLCWLILKKVSVWRLFFSAKSKKKQKQTFFRLRFSMICLSKSISKRLFCSVFSMRLSLALFFLFKISAPGAQEKQTIQTGKKRQLTLSSWIQAVSKQSVIK